jgi:hypothetical protein
VRVGPGIERAPGKFLPLSTTFVCGKPTVCFEEVEHPGDAQTRQRAIDFNGRALPRELVHDVERAKRPATASVTLRRRQPNPALWCDLVRACTPG